MAADVFPPWGPDTPVHVYVGSWTVPTSPPAPVIVIQIAQWKRLSDGACSATQIGSSAGLNDDYVVHGTTGNDRFLVNKFPGVPFCGKTIYPLAYNGHFLDLVGGNGDDYMVSYFGDTWQFGEGGNDDLYFTNPTGRLDGGAGADELQYIGVSGTTELLGGSGNDCLRDTNRTSSRFDCGSGTDTRITNEYPVSGTISCELTSGPYCP
jgi:Ca2+-binding RTX toxin-like protein